MNTYQLPILYVEIIGGNRGAIRLDSIVAVQETSARRPPERCLIWVAGIGGQDEESAFLVKASYAHILAVWQGWLIQKQNQNRDPFFGDQKGPPGEEGETHDNEKG